LTIYQASLERFEEILHTRSLDRTPPILLTLPSENEAIKNFLERLKKAIEGTTRYISDIYLYTHDGEPINAASNPAILAMHKTHVADPLREKITQQLCMEKTIKAEPYGPYFDFFRSPDAAHNNAGRPFPPSEVIGLREAPDSIFSKPTAHISPW
jgi:hypothetical protein